LRGIWKTSAKGKSGKEEEIKEGKSSACPCAVQEAHLLCLLMASDKSPAFPAQALASCGRDVNKLFSTSVLWN